MKAVMKSVSPQICEKITSGNCTILISKTAPKCDAPFIGYVYCTKAKSQWRYSDYEGAYENNKSKIVYAQQRVVGEFVCNKIERIEPIFDFYYSYSGYNDSSDSSYFKGYFIDVETLDKIGLTEQELCDYGDGEVLYAWYISDLKIYDKPKKLSDFLKPCPDPYRYCTICKHCIKIIPPDEEEYALYHGGHYDYCEEYCGNILRNPPKGWQYVEEYVEELDR